jgi:hypothetical protein
MQKVLGDTLVRHREFLPCGAIPAPDCGGSELKNQKSG